MHLGHCLAAIASGQTHRQAVAYCVPWNCEWDEDEGVSTCDEENSWNTDVRRIALKTYWQIIQSEYDNIGRKQFNKIIEELDEPFYSDCLVYYSPVGEGVNHPCSPEEILPPAPPPFFVASPISDEGFESEAVVACNPAARLPLQMS
jgi:hypothetical protein